MSSDVPINEFLGEAEEIVDSLNSDLIIIHGAVTKNVKFDPSLINNIFRAAHSLKGISGLFGFTELTGLSHTMETMLDRLRLGKISLNEDVLDLLFESTDMLRIIVASKAHGGASPDNKNIDALIGRLENAGQEKTEDAEDDISCVGDEILAVLTEYEEHRLFENVKEGVNIIKIRAAFDLATFDEGLTELQAITKNYGEIITTLPSADESADDKITFDIIIGTDQPLERVSDSLAGRPLSFDLLRGGRLPPPPEEDQIPEAAEPAPPPEPKKPAAAAEEAGPAEPDEPEPELSSSLKTISQTVRVDIHKLDNLMNIVGELVIAKNIMSQLVERLREEAGFSGLVMEFIKNTRTLERKLSDLQSGVLEVRMVPVGQIFDKLHRNIRKLSREMGKDIEFAAEGGDTELDKLIIEDLADPLMHIIRNSMDHGIESKAERIQLSKPERALIKLRAFQRGNHVVVEVQDDGAGLDYEKIRRKAVSMGLLDQNVEPREEELIECLFLPGFSTADKVSEISGRGVGLDVVKSNIGALSGAIDVDSQPGDGTRFVITLPITLAIIQALIVEAGAETFAIPLNSVQQGMMIKPDEIQTIEGREVIELRGKTLPLLRLDKLFGLGAATETPKPENAADRVGAIDDELDELMAGLDGAGNGAEADEAVLEAGNGGGAGDEIYVIKVGIAERGLGIIVDQLWGRQDIVIKSVGEILKGIRGIAGATELGNQRTILVLDVMDLMDEAAVSTLGLER